MRVQQIGDTVQLLAREGAFSVYDPTCLFTGYSWDCLSVAAGFCVKPKRILLLGVGGGTVIRQCRQLYPECSIDGVEVDDKVIDAAYRFFALESSGARIIHADAAAFVSNGVGKRYDAILDDIWPARSGLSKPLFSVPDYVASVGRLLEAGGVYAVNLWCDRSRFSELRLAAQLLQELGRALWTLCPRHGSTCVLVAAPRWAGPLARDRARELSLQIQPLSRKHE